MKRFLFLFPFLFLCLPASADTIVVADCGSTGITYPAGGVGHNYAIHTSGIVCSNSSGGGGGLSVQDRAAWTQASSNFTPGGCTFNDTATLTSGTQGTFRCTTKRAQIFDVDTAGNALYDAVTGPIPAASNNDTVIGSVGAYNFGAKYETVVASQTAQVLGPTGATGDYLSHCVVYPATTSPGVVTVFDNASAAGTDAIAFAGGASSVSNLVPFSVPVGAVSTAGPWKVTTGANVKVTCYGKFT